MQTAAVIEDPIFQDGLEKRIMYLTKLEEKREKLIDHIIEHQRRVKTFFDKRATPRKFKQGDMVLLWDKRREAKGKHHKFDSLWMGPFRIQRINQNNSYILAYPSGETLPLSYNGQDLKLYQMLK